MPRPLTLLPPSRLWQRWGGLVRLLLGALALVLGLWGFVRQEPPHTAVAWFNTAFRTLQLLTLQFPRELTDVPWQLNIARFLLPTLAVLETVRLLTGSVLRPVRLALLGVFSRPVLVSVGPGGAGQGGAGMEVLRQLGAARQARAALNAGLPADAAATLADSGVPSLELDPAEPAAWQRLHADKARLVVIAHGDDVANLNAAATVAPLLRASTRRPAPGLLVLLERTGLADAVEAALDRHRAGDPVRYRRLSVMDETVRRLFLDPPPVLLRPGRPAHVAILGYGAGGPSVLRHALTLGQDAPGAPPRITVFADPLATPGEALLGPGAVPTFLADLRVVPWDEAGALPPDVPGDVTQWCVCRPDEPGLETALTLLHRGARVAVHQARRNAFVPALADGPDGRLRVFGGVLPEGAVRRMLAEADDALPRQMHETYLEDLRRQGAVTGSTEDWDALTETLRDSNRAAAAHIPVKLAALGCTVAEGSGPPFAFTDAELDVLAPLEHRRWCADRVVHGWRHAPVTDRAARLHRDLVPFEELDDESRQKDHDALRAIPALLACAGLHVVPLVSACGGVNAAPE